MSPRYRDEEWLRQKVLDEGLTDSEIADLEDVTQTTITTWRNRFDIPPSRETRGKHQDEEWTVQESASSD